MKIAIQAADLDADRIDGTRVYILNCLKYFGKIDPASDFLIYHKNKFNPELTPPDFSNYKVIAKFLPHLWTQTVFAYNLLKHRPDVLWMPMHNIPLIRRYGMKTVVTIHDLAFKYFPETFTKKDLFKINVLTKIALNRSDKIIAISQSSKKDIMKFYPEIGEEKIEVIYHGFDGSVFEKERDLTAERELKNNLKIGESSYILYIGAIQPRKNLTVLIEAFEKIKKEGQYNDLKLVLAGEKAWLFEEVFNKIKNSQFKEDIIVPGKIKFEDLGHLMRGARIFCFPSLYEGFGIPILEAFAARVPVVSANNSSLPEVAGNAALYFDGKNSTELGQKLKKILEDDNLRKDLIQKGIDQMKKFSWEKCARETLEYLKS